MGVAGYVKTLYHKLFDPSQRSAMAVDWTLNGPFAVLRICTGGRTNQFGELNTLAVNPFLGCYPKLAKALARGCIQTVGTSSRTHPGECNNG